MTYQQEPEDRKAIVAAPDYVACLTCYGNGWNYSTCGGRTIAVECNNCNGTGQLKVQKRDFIR